MSLVFLLLTLIGPNLPECPTEDTYVPSGCQRFDERTGNLQVNVGTETNHMTVIIHNDD